MKLEQRDRKFLGRDSDAEEFQVARTEGSCVVDANGKRYIDESCEHCLADERKINEASLLSWFLWFCLLRRGLPGVLLCTVLSFARHRSRGPVIRDVLLQGDARNRAADDVESQVV